MLTQTRMTLSRPPLKRRLAELYRVKTLPLWPRNTLQYAMIKDVRGGINT